MASHRDVYAYLSLLLSLSVRCIDSKECFFFLFISFDHTVKRNIRIVNSNYRQNYNLVCRKNVSKLPCWKIVRSNSEFTPKHWEILSSNRKFFLLESNVNPIETPELAKSFCLDVSVCEFVPISSARTALSTNLYVRLKCMNPEARPKPLEQCNWKLFCRQVKSIKNEKRKPQQRSATQPRQLYFNKFIGLQHFKSYSVFNFLFPFHFQLLVFNCLPR